MINNKISVIIPCRNEVNHIGNVLDSILKSDYPNAYSLQNQELSLPIYPEMTTDQIDYVVEKIKNFK